MLDGVASLIALESRSIALRDYLVVFKHNVLKRSLRSATASLHHPLRFLQVQALRLSFLLRLHDPFPRAPEVRHLHPHSSLSQSHQASLRADSLDVSAGQIIFLIDELV